MTSKHRKCGILECMAVLRKQRKLLKVLRELEIEQIKSPPERFGIDKNFEKAISLIGTGHHYVYENKLILRLIEEKSFCQEKKAEFYDWKKVLDSCINARPVLVDWIKNENREAKDMVGHTEEELISKRLVQVNSDKGMEIIDDWHYWLVHVPNTFPEPSRIIIGVATAIITTLITIYVVGGNI